MLLRPVFGQTIAALFIYFKVDGSQHGGYRNSTQGIMKDRGRCHSHRAFIVIFCLTLQPLRAFAWVAFGRTGSSSNNKFPPVGVRRSPVIRSSAAAMGDTPSPSSSHKESYESLAKKALVSIRYCAMASLGSAAMDLVASVINQIFPTDAAAADLEGLIPKPRHLLSMIQSLEAVDSVYRILFGAGLFAVSKLYAKSLQKDAPQKKLGHKEIYDLSSIMSKLWGGATILVIMVCLVDVTVLKEDLPDTSLLSSMIVGPASIGALAAATLAAVGFSVSSAQQEASQKYPLGKPENKETKVSTARSTGFAAARNMAFFMGSLFVMGVVNFLIATLKPMGMVDRVFKLLDVCEDIVYIQLLRTLNKCFLSAVAQATDNRQRPAESNGPLFEAQTKFYNRLGQTFLFTSGFQLLLPLYNAGVAVWKMIQS